MRENTYCRINSRPRLRTTLLWSVVLLAVGTFLSPRDAQAGDSDAATTKVHIDTREISILSSDESTSEIEAVVAGTLDDRIVRKSQVKLPEAKKSRHTNKPLRLTDERVTISFKRATNRKDRENPPFELKMACGPGADSGQDISSVQCRKFLQSKLQDVKFPISLRELAMALGEPICVYPNAAWAFAYSAENTRLHHTLDSAREIANSGEYRKGAKVKLEHKPGSEEVGDVSVEDLLNFLPEEDRKQIRPLVAPTIYDAIDHVEIGRDCDTKGSTAPRSDFELGRNERSVVSEQRIDKPALEEPAQTPQSPKKVEVSTSPPRSKSASKSGCACDTSNAPLSNAMPCYLVALALTVLKFRRRDHC